MKYSLSLMTGLVLLATNLQAQITTWYMTGTGTGTRNGQSWNDAFSATSSQQMIDVISGTMQPGDTLLIGGSQAAWYVQQPVTGTNTSYTLPPPGQDYRDRRVTLPATAGGTANAPKTIRGVDRGFGLPVFFGIQKTPSYAAFELTGTCSYITFEDLDLRRRAYGIQTMGTSHQGIVARRVKSYLNTKAGFYFIHSDDLLLEDCIAERYINSGFKIYYGCDRVTIRNCIADCTQGENDSSIPTNWMHRSDSPVGFDFHQRFLAQPPNTEILLENCAALNNVGTKPSSGPQGDGYMVQQDNHNIVFRKCIADTFTDAGYDLKGPSQTLNDCAAVNGKLGVKVWYQGTFNNYVGVNNSLAQFFVDGVGTDTLAGPIIVNNSTMHCGASTQYGVIIDKANRDSNFNNCLMTFSGPAGVYVKHNAADQTGAIWPTHNPPAPAGRYANTASGTTPPRYQNPVIPWDGKGTNYDNQDFGTTKGYNSTVVTPPSATTGRVISVNMAASGTNTLAPTNVVGVIPVSSWNNSTLNSELILNLVDSGSAAVPGASAIFSTTNYSYVNSTTTQPPPLDDDSKMMRSHRAGSNTTSTTATMTGVPYSTYDVYVYWGGRTTGESVPATMMVELQLLNTGTYGTAPNSTFYIRDTNRTWDGTYNESTATTSAAAVDGNEFVVFRNLTAPEFRIRSSGSITRTGISGFQVVEKP